MSDTPRFYKFVRAFLEKVDPLSITGVADEFREINVLTRLEKESAKRLGNWLKLTFQDILIVTEGWPADRIAAADSALIEVGAPSLSSMKKLRLTRLVSILKKGTIKNDGQYEYAMSLLSDSRDLLSIQEAESLERMVLQYEDSHSGPP